MVSTTTTNHLLKGSGSFLLSSHHHHILRRCPFLLPTTARIINNRIRSTIVTPVAAPPLPISLHRDFYDQTKTSLPKGMMCYCTAPNALDTIVASDEGNAKNEEDNGELTVEKIREAANTLDIRVGRILKAWRHEEADSLYVEEVDVGEPEPRIICSGLVKYVPLHLLQDRNIVVLANLKPRNMRGVKSNGMLMAASDASHESVELLVPPEGAIPGERVWFGSPEEKENLPDAASPNQVQKKKIWEQVQPHLETDDSCVAVLGTHYMRTSAGLIVSQSLKNARIS
ncbi:aminoacyl tRNA synthase complex-interacting multifunctional protein 1 [Olea europaea var. sylvestris]|uniref:aminoacyl tRNA synthase complex-interacting multifunctional protein 1 n=1 Tax=Olea europaea var. sylvestris TaxID=158386 RepID=UPI000C1CE494|nr:aminoacyl tRNA synthase complex-interacting multifunctional protein 1 [Olea europaea var. sylvestris]